MGTADVVGIKSKRIEIHLDALDPNRCESDSCRIFYNTLNAANPTFERFVIQSLRAVRDDSRLEADPRLRGLIDVFIRQEAEHSYVKLKVLNHLSDSRRAKVLGRVV